METSSGSELRLIVLATPDVLRNSDGGWRIDPQQTGPTAWAEWVHLTYSDSHRCGVNTVRCLASVAVRARVVDAKKRTPAIIHGESCKIMDSPAVDEKAISRLRDLAREAVVSVYGSGNSYDAQRAQKLTRPRVWAFGNGVLT